MTVHTCVHHMHTRLICIHCCIMTQYLSRLLLILPLFYCNNAELLRCNYMRLENPVLLLMRCDVAQYQYFAAFHNYYTLVPLLLIADALLTLHLH
jgi:hypothetical protein